MSKIIPGCYLEVLKIKQRLKWYPIDTSSQRKVQKSFPGILLFKYDKTEYFKVLEWAVHANKWKPKKSFMKIKSLAAHSIYATVVNKIILTPWTKNYFHSRVETNEVFLLFLLFQYCYFISSLFFQFSDVSLKHISSISPGISFEFNFCVIYVVEN